MATKKKSAPSARAALLQSAHTAYQLALDHRADLEPRLPAGMLDGLAADLGLLDVLSPPVAPAPATPPPSFAAAASRVALLVTAIHEAVHAAKPSAPLRKAYGATSRSAGKDVNKTLGAASAIIAQASAHPAEALGLGILPSDITALEAAVADLTTAQGQAQKKGKKASISSKDKRAATVRVAEGLRRIAAAGILHFAQTAQVRSNFEALANRRG